MVDRRMVCPLPISGKSCRVLFYNGKGAPSILSLLFPSVVLATLSQICMMKFFASLLLVSAALVSSFDEVRLHHLAYTYLYQHITNKLSTPT